MAAGAAAGIAAGAAGWLLATATICAIAEIAAAQTPAVGILSSTWTPLTGTATVVAGGDALSGTLQVGWVIVGLVLLAAVWLGLGLATAGALHWLLGPRPDPVVGALLGAAVGTTALIALVAIVNGLIQQTPYAYESLPPFGWWIAFVTGGALLGLVAARASDAAAGAGLVNEGAS